MARPQTMAADGTIARLTGREIRRGAVILVVSLPAVMYSYMASYSAVAKSGVNGLSSLTGNPAFRALYGVPYNVHTKGGFAVWRGTTVVLVIAGLWAALAATRVLRGEEEAGRWDLLLAEPLHRSRTTAVHLAVLGLVSIVLGAAIALTFLAAGQPATGSFIYGCGVGLFTLMFVTIGSTAAQLFASRRLAAGISGALVGIMFVIRMAADAVSGGAWMRWLTPFGWVEELRTFAAERAWPLLLLGLSSVALAALSMDLVRRRDLGDGIIRTSETAPPRTKLLVSPLSFAWRQRLGGLAGWSAGVGFYGLVIGAITASLTKFISENESTYKLMTKLGFTQLTSPAGFVGSVAGFIGVAFVLYAVSSFRRCHEDEEEGRLDLPYAAKVTRSSWLGAEVGTTAAATLAVAMVVVICTWLGAVAGNAGLTLRESLVAIFNLLPAVGVFFGLAVLLHGTRPQLIVPIAGGGAIAAYLLSFLGAALRWPHWVLDLSPFHHLSNAPVVPVDWTAAAVMLGLTALAVVLGFVTYQRRDLA